MRHSLRTRSVTATLMSFSVSFLEVSCSVLTYSVCSYCTISSITDCGQCHDWCTLSFTGLTLQNESSTSTMYSCTDANTTKLLGTRWTTVHQFPTSFSASICVWPAVTNSPYHVTGSACTAVGRFLLLARLSGTHCWKTFGIRSALLTVTDSRWRQY